jgi:hypothetical protein
MGGGWGRGCAAQRGASARSAQRAPGAAARRAAAPATLPANCFQVAASCATGAAAGVRLLAAGRRGLRGAAGRAAPKGRGLGAARDLMAGAKVEAGPNSPAIIRRKEPRPLRSRSSDTPARPLPHANAALPGRGTVAGPPSLRPGPRAGRPGLPQLHARAASRHAPAPRHARPRPPTPAMASAAAPAKPGSPPAAPAEPLAPEQRLREACIKVRRGKGGGWEGPPTQAGAQPPGPRRIAQPWLGGARGPPTAWALVSRCIPCSLRASARPDRPRRRQRGRLRCPWPPSARAPPTPRRPRAHWRGRSRGPAAPLRLRPSNAPAARRAPATPPLPLLPPLRPPPLPPGRR